MSKFIPIIVIAAALAVLIGVFALQSSPKGEPHAGMIEGNDLRRVPDFSLKDYNGKTVTLADFSGQPLVINSWAVWCPFCVKELKDFVAVQRELGDKVIFLAIDREESLAVAKKFTDENGLTGDLIFLLDPNDSFYQAIGGFSMPETVFADSDGVIRDHKRGPMAMEEIRERVRKIIN